MNLFSLDIYAHILSFMDLESLRRYVLFYFFLAVWCDQIVGFSIKYTVTEHFSHIGIILYVDGIK